MEHKATKWPRKLGSRQFHDVTEAIITAHGMAKRGEPAKEILDFYRWCALYATSTRTRWEFSKLAAQWRAEAEWWRYHNV